MKVVNVMELHGTEREVECPRGGFTSIRMLVKKDGMGFGMTRTTIHPTDDFQMWHYKNHLEACYCIKGRGILKDSQGRKHNIKPGMLYALDNNDKHWFKAVGGSCILICVFNPPLIGREVHSDDGSYELEKPSERISVSRL